MSLSRGTCVALGALLVLGVAWWRTRPTPGTPAPVHVERPSIELEVDPRGIERSHSVAIVELDFDDLLHRAGRQGTLDAGSLEVVALDAAGAPRAFDPAARREDRWRVPWRLRRAYPGGPDGLSFVLKDQTHTRFRVSFESEGAAPGIHRYRGLVGDGDLFSLAEGRREVAASGYGAFVDLDGDGDLDLLQGGTASTLSYLENVGGSRFVERGLLASDGAALNLPADDGKRSWVSVGAADTDGDGDQDLFLHLGSGLRAGEVVAFENVSRSPSRFSFAERGSLRDVSGRLVGGPVAFVDWDGDGSLDGLSAEGAQIVLYRNLGPTPGPVTPRLAAGEPLRANGVPIQLKLARVDAGDIDGDGDLDLFAASDEGRIYLFDNVGTRREPVLGIGRLLVHHGYMDARAGVKVADFDGDGLLDFVVGRYWKRTTDGDQPVVHGRLYRNAGTAREPRFEARDARHGAPFTQGFQAIDALRQNGVRASDWDEDGRLDLIAGDTDGYVWFFRNAGTRSFPLFEAGLRLRTHAGPIRVLGEELEGRRAGYARPEITDWNDDGRKDLLVADGRGWLTLFLNRGREGRPQLLPGVRVEANGHAIDGTGRASVAVADWDDDGRKDLLFAMVGEDVSARYDWPRLNEDPSQDAGILLYRNVGSDAAPSFGRPQWIRAGRFGGDEIRLLRPNLGAFADWDGDGRKDLIACEFEDKVFLFRNTSRRPGRPKFASHDEVRQLLLAAETRELISGADVVDWDGDGQLDLLTGQGHGGSGLRFYSRDYLRDLRDGTLPLVKVADRAQAQGGAPASSPGSAGR
ncbi:MAG: FG-GAP repeat domain-containing protein [Vicinamibacteria bacterium]